MRIQTWMTGVVAMALVGSASADRVGNISFENRIQFRYDDNIRLVTTGDGETESKASSLRITNEATLSGSMRLDNSFLGLRYQAGLNWFDDRDEDDLDINHQVDLTWSQTISRRISFNLTDAFRWVERPELIREDGSIQRRESTYLYNTLRGTLTTVLAPDSRLDTSGRYVVMRHEDDLLAERDDYDLIAAGVTLHHQVRKNLSAMLDARVESTDYIGAGTFQPGVILFPGAEQVRQREVPDRSADTFSGGVGIDTVFGPNLVGIFRAGVSHKEYKAANTDGRTSPYADISLTYTISPLTRMTLGLSHQLFQSGLITYVNQMRNAVDFRMAHDLSSRLQLTLSGQMVHSDYQEKESVDLVGVGEVQDGTELALTGGVRLSYKIAESHWLETGWSYTELDSELRSDYRRNVYDISWRVRL